MAHDVVHNDICHAAGPLFGPKFVCMPQEVDLSDNQLKGTLPATINVAQDLRVLALSNNSFSGPLPLLYSVDHMVVGHLL